MFEIYLTKESDYLICQLYKNYLKNRKGGMSKYDAKFTGDSHHIHDTVMPNWSFEDADETCRELDRADTA